MKLTKEEEKRLKELGKKLPLLDWMPPEKEKKIQEEYFELTKKKTA